MALEMIACVWFVLLACGALSIVVMVVEGEARGVVGWWSFAVVGEGLISPCRRGRGFLSVHLSM